MFLDTTSKKSFSDEDNTRNRWISEVTMLSVDEFSFLLAIPEILKKMLFCMHQRRLFICHDLFMQGVAIMDRSTFYDSRNYFDQHRDLRLDIDNMSYEVRIFFSFFKKK